MLTRIAALMGILIGISAALWGSSAIASEDGPECVFETDYKEKGEMTADAAPTLVEEGDGKASGTVDQKSK